MQLIKTVCIKLNDCFFRILLLLYIACVISLRMLVETAYDKNVYFEYIVGMFAMLMLILFRNRMPSCLMSLPYTIYTIDCMAKLLGGYTQINMKGYNAGIFDWLQMIMLVIVVFYMYESCNTNTASTALEKWKVVKRCLIVSFFMESGKIIRLASLLNLDGNDRRMYEMSFDMAFTALYFLLCILITAPKEVIINRLRLDTIIVKYLISLFIFFIIQYIYSVWNHHELLSYDMIEIWIYYSLSIMFIFIYSDMLLGYIKVAFDGFKRMRTKEKDNIDQLNALYQELNNRIFSEEYANGRLFYNLNDIKYLDQLQAQLIYITELLLSIDQLEFPMPKEEFELLMEENKRALLGDLMVNYNIIV